MEGSGSKLTPEAILKLLAQTRERPNYVATVLEFQLGRKPTQAEINQVYQDSQLRRAAFHKWLSTQPWHIRKRHVDKIDRIERVMRKRYNVPEFLLKLLVKELDPGDWY